MLTPYLTCRDGLTLPPCGKVDAGRFSPCKISTSQWQLGSRPVVLLLAHSLLQSQQGCYRWTYAFLQVASDPRCGVWRGKTARTDRARRSRVLITAAT